MIIVEFCGTPGCGKTTLCNKIEKYYSDQGLRVSNLRKRRANTTLIDKMCKALYLIRININYLVDPLRKEAFLYSKRFDNPKSRFWAKRMVEGSYRVRKAEKNNTEIGLFDEGFIQYITSICFGSKIEDGVNDLLANIESDVYKNRCLIVHCKLGIDNNIGRLKERNRVDRFFSGTEEEIREKIVFKEKQIDDLCQFVDNSRIINVDLSDFDAAFETIRYNIDLLIK